MTQILVITLVLPITLSLTSDVDPLIDNEPNRELFLSLGSSKSICEDSLYSIAAAAFYVFNELGTLEDYSDFYTGGVRVYISRLGQDHKPEIKMLELAPGRNKGTIRQKVVGQFMAKVLKAVKETVKQPVDYTANKIDAGLCYQLSWLQKSQFSENKSVFILMDGTQTDPIPLNVFIQEDDPEHEILLALTPLLIHILEEIHPFPDLAGLKVNLRNSNRPEYPEFTHTLTRFWAHRLSKAGANEIWFAPKIQE